MYKVKLDGKYLYHPWDKNRLISSGNLSLEIGKNGTFDCTIPMENPLYQSMALRKSIVEVIRFRIDPESLNTEEETVYRGVYFNDADGLQLEREAETDGDMVFFGDTVQRPHDRTTSPQEEFRLVISEHNNNTDQFKRFEIGRVDISGSAIRRNQLGYIDTKSALESLQEAYGGNFRSRTESGITYIDWISTYDHQANQSVRYGQNIIDITKYLKAEEVVTRIVPIGKTFDDVPTTIKSVNNGVDYLRDEETEKQFGIIEKTVEFSDIESPSALKQSGEEWLKSNKGAALTIEVSAVDLADFDINIEYLNIGDWIHCEAKAYGIDALMQIAKISLDILKPSNSTITLGSTMQTYTQRQIANTSKIDPVLMRAINSSSSALQAANNAISEISEISKKIFEFNDFYPIGTIYETMDEEFDPNKIWTGKWERIKGCVLVGVDEDDSDFNVSGNSGGEKKHTLSASELPKISGTITMHNQNVATNVHAVSGVFSAKKIISKYFSGESGYSGAKSVSIIGFDVGGGISHNNMPPYQTCYIWKRVE